MVDTLTPVTAVTTVLMGVTNFVPLFALLPSTLKILLYIKFLHVTFYVSAYVNFLVKEWLMWDLFTMACPTLCSALIE